jgi:hypothetical protein
MGANTITWQTYLIATGITVSTVTQTVTVIDNQPLPYHVRANITVNLDPGACNAAVNFVVRPLTIVLCRTATTSQLHGSAAPIKTILPHHFWCSERWHATIKNHGVNANLGIFPARHLIGVVSTASVLVH